MKVELSEQELALLSELVRFARFNCDELRPRRTEVELLVDKLEKAMIGHGQE